MSRVNEDRPVSTRVSGLRFARFVSTRNSTADIVVSGYRRSDYAQDVEALVRQQIREPAILFGHSLGAVVALWVAAYAPELVRGLVLEDPPLYVVQRLDESVFGFAASSLARRGVVSERSPGYGASMGG